MIKYNIYFLAHLLKFLINFNRLLSECYFFFTYFYTPLSELNEISTDSIREKKYQGSIATELQIFWAIDSNFWCILQFDRN